MSKDFNKKSLHGMVKDIYIRFVFNLNHLNMRDEDPLVVVAEMLRKKIDILKS